MKTKKLLIPFLVFLIIGTILLSSYLILVNKNVHTVQFVVTNVYFRPKVSDSGAYHEIPYIALNEGSDRVHLTTQSNIWGFVDQPQTVPVSSEFAGWYIDRECTIPFDFSKDRVHSDIVLYAKQIQFTKYNHY